MSIKIVPEKTPRRPWHYPPFYLGLAILLMLALRRWLPMKVWHAGASKALGVALAILALAVGFWGSVLFLRAKTTIKPFEESSTLVTWGPYRFSRNPSYLSMVVLLFGIAFWLEALTPFFVIPLFALVVQRRVIEAEERGLEEKFGGLYNEYRRRVRRWI